MHRKIAVAICVLALFSSISESGDSLTKSDLLRMAEAEVSEELMLSVVAKALEVPDLTVDELIELREAGVTNRVLEAIDEKAEIPRPTTTKPDSGTAATKPRDPGKSSTEFTLPVRIPASDMVMYPAAGDVAAETIHIPTRSWAYGTLYFVHPMDFVGDATQTLWIVPKGEHPPLYVKSSIKLDRNRAAGLRPRR